MEGTNENLEMLKKLIDWIKSLREDKFEYTELETGLLLDILQTLVKNLTIPVVIGSNPIDLKDAYKECFEIFIPVERWDEANKFLSTYGSGLAKELAKKGK